MKNASLKKVRVIAGTGTKNAITTTLLQRPSVVKLEQFLL